MKWIGAMWNRLDANVGVLKKRFLSVASDRLHHTFSPAGNFSAAAPSGIALLLTGSTLAVVLILVFLNGL